MSVVHEVIITIWTYKLFAVMIALMTMILIYLQNKYDTFLYVI